MEKPKLGPNRGNAGKGRPKGSRNKATMAIKDMIVEALERSGGIDYLVAQASQNPSAFLSLVAKVMPTQVVGAGENGEHLHKVDADEAFARIAGRLAGTATGSTGGPDCPN